MPLAGLTERIFHRQIGKGGKEVYNKHRAAGFYLAHTAFIHDCQIVDCSGGNLQPAAGGSELFHYARWVMVVGAVKIR